MTGGSGVSTSDISNGARHFRSSRKRKLSGRAFV